MKSWIQIMFMLVLSLGCCVAHADSASEEWLLYPSVTFKGLGIDDNGSPSNTFDLYGDLRFGYRWSFGLYGGLMDSMASGFGNNGYGLSQMALGPTVGYIQGNWAITASYFLFATRTEHIGTDTIKRSRANGYQLDFTYLIPFSTAVMVGPSLVYRQLFYADQVVNSNDLQNHRYGINDFFPYLSAVFLF